MRAKLLTLFVIAMVVSGMVQYRIDNKTDHMAEKNVFVTLPPGKTIKILSFGHHDLVADMLFIWSIQFYSAYHYNNRYDYLWRIYDTITDISPTYKEPYVVGAWIMALEAQEVEMAIRLLQKASSNMPREYYFDYECAYYCATTLKQYERAAEFYRRASVKPGAPHWLKRRVAHMVYMNQDRDRAWNLWSEIMRNAKTNLEKSSAFKHLYQIKFEIDQEMIEKKLKLYKEKFGSYPPDLQRLVKSGFLKEVPLDYSGNPYVFTPGSDTISSVNLFKWK